MKVAIDGGHRHDISAWAVVNMYDDGPKSPDQGQTWSGVMPSSVTSNMAEYHALLHALKIGIDRSEKILIVQSDSELLVRQVNGEYACRDEKLLPLLYQAKNLIVLFEDFLIFHVRREKNYKADEVVNFAMDEHIRLHGTVGLNCSICGGTGHKRVELLDRGNYDHSSELQPCNHGVTA